MALLNGLEFSPTFHPHCAHSLGPLCSSQRTDPTLAGGSPGAFWELHQHTNVLKKYLPGKTAFLKYAALLTSLPKVSNIRWKGPENEIKFSPKESVFFLRWLAIETYCFIIWELNLSLHLQFFGSPIAVLRYQTLKTIFEVVSSISPRQHAYFVHVAAYIKTHTGTHAHCFSNTYTHLRHKDASPKHSRAFLILK